jgi:Na+/H+-dicarboxylate symporter
MDAGKLLAWFLGAAAAAALVALTVLLAVQPAFSGCDSDYNGPPTPGHAGSVAFGTLVAAIVGWLVSLGVGLGAAPGTPTRRWALRALGIGLLAIVAALAACGVVLARWSCWP